MADQDNGRQLGQLLLEVELEQISNQFKFEMIEKIQEFISVHDHDISNEAMNVALHNFRNLIDSTSKQIATIRNEVKDFVDQIRESDRES